MRNQSARGECQTSVYETGAVRYELAVDDYACNRFGLAEVFAHHYRRLALPEFRTALDVGSGVGPISIFLADQYELQVTAVEINPVAYRCCRENLETYGVADRVTTWNINFACALSLLPVNAYDLIVANPPISNVSMPDSYGASLDAQLQRGMNGELFMYLTNAWRDKQGLDLVDHIFRFADRRLSATGRIVLVCCDVDVDSQAYMARKADQYGYLQEERVECSIPPGRIGVDSRAGESIACHLFHLRKATSDRPLGSENCQTEAKHHHD